ncbi:hypothetical protein A3K73_05985 [Candidatus Pacearchaeota archaeon RBG_13_36_9]|nr:MAG: hypothetical protein A3K73_05985 [Candidatus Pacearchaeota archaeon RBG_13_36_9]
MKQEKKETAAEFNIKHLLVGLAAILLSAFFLFTEKGKAIFIPLEDCPHFLQFYYYLISYSLVAVSLFFILRGLGFVKMLSKP